MITKLNKDTYYFINWAESETQPVTREQFDEAVLTNHSFVYLFEAPSFNHYYAYQNEEDYQRCIKEMTK